MKTILVTGGAGFIGSHLCERLLKLGYKVINFDNFNDYYNPQIKRDNIATAQKDLGYTLIEGDIRENSILTEIFEKYDIDIIIHLAALAGVRKSIENPLEYIDTDIKGTVNMLEAAKDYKVKKVIFASSSSVYGLNRLPFKEGDNTDMQISPYAASKKSGELFCKVYNTIYKIPIICLRFFTVYGPRQRPEMGIYKFVNAIHEEKEICIFGNGQSSRDYTYIDDIIDGIVASIYYECDFEIFNLGNSKSVILNDLIDIIEEKIGKQWLRKYEKEQQGDVMHTFADINKAKKILGYNPKISIDEGIKRFVNWYTKNRSKIYVL